MKRKAGGDLIEKREAIFSDCEKYRYRLEIVWDASKPRCQFIGLNPSTADEMKDDPTIRRCKDFAKRWGCGGLLMTNLFAYRATDPKDMLNQNFPDGVENSEMILAAAKESAIIVAAWGNHGEYQQRGYYVRLLLEGQHHRVQCLEIGSMYLTQIDFDKVAMGGSIFKCLNPSPRTRCLRSRRSDCSFWDIGIGGFRQLSAQARRVFIKMSEVGT